MSRVYKSLYIFICAVFIVSMTGCTAIRATGKVLDTTGRLAFATAKTVGKVALTTAKWTGKGVKTVVYMARGKHIISLDKRGNSLIANTLLNRKVRAELVLDTGCSETQISEEVASELGLTYSPCKTVLCQVADGRQVNGKEVVIKEIKLGTVRVTNVRAIVLGSDNFGQNGLLGMSFLEKFIFKIDSEKGELILQKRI
ncbi:MAG: retroviral-like aspartic protease family protein [Candidatus Omnitrophica bacterium]|nr:retroviral-like aspartic protease family protein [Candidatus Omnitrophota bacterium]